MFTREAAGASGSVALRRAGRGAAAGRRHAVPAGVLLPGGEGAQRAVGLQGRPVPEQEAGLRRGLVQTAVGRGEC